MSENFLGHFYTTVGVIGFLLLLNLFPLLFV